MQLGKLFPVFMIAAGLTCIGAAAYVVQRELGEHSVTYSSRFIIPSIYNLTIDYDGRETADFYDYNIDGELDHFVQYGPSVRQTAAFSSQKRA